jgi:hypothetical protein
MDITDSIFIKKSDSNINNTMGIAKVDIIGCIPDLTINKKDIEKRKYMLEMRWRLYKIPINDCMIEDKEVVEISIKYPDSTRLFINTKGKWIPKKISNKYKKYMTEIYYHYSDY